MNDSYLRFITIFFRLRIWMTKNDFLRELFVGNILKLIVKPYSFAHSQIVSSIPIEQ